MKFFLSLLTIFFAIGLQNPVAIAKAQVSLLAPKLPYEKGQSFVVTQGFHSPPTHIKKDDFAIDFTQNGCDAYAKPALSALSGKAWIIQESGYNGGYGTQLLILSGSNIVSRYAHLIPGSVTVSAGEEISQGMPIGLIGDSGLVMGTACGIHPGTHLHFAMDTKNPDGSFSAQDPEPISGYENIHEGAWYLSDNALFADIAEKANLSAIVAATIDDASGTNVVDQESGTSSNVSFGSEVVQVSSSGEASLATGTPSSQPSVGVLSTSSFASIQGFSVSSTLNALGAASSGGISVPPQNSIVPPIGGVMALPAQAVSLNSAASTNLVNSSSSQSLSGNIVSSSETVSMGNVGGGVVTSSQSADASSSIFGDNESSSPVSSAFVLDPPLVASGSNSLSSFNSSTLAVDIAWQPTDNATGSGLPAYNIFLIPENSSTSIFIASTTSSSFFYPVSDSDFGATDSFAVQAVDGASHQSAFATTTVAIPSWFSGIESYDGDESRPSWYSDNWYDLGTGFAGTMRSLALEGFINSDIYGGSSVALQEFPDASYVNLDHTFPIAPTPFTQTPSKIVVSGLKIPLSSEKYYRLTTLQSYQNRSVVLKGTSATGTAMFDEFAPGIGGIQNTYQFYPYLSAVIDPQEERIAPPSLSGTIAVSFDAANSQIDISWPAAMDIDELFVSSTYEVNFSTSTSFDPAGWRSASVNLSTSSDVAYPNSYTIGVRAVDHFGQSSVPLVVNWNFPSGYAPLAQFDHSTGLSSDGGMQKVTFFATTTASGIDLWTAYDHSGATHSDAETELSVYKDQNGLPGDEINSGNPVVDLTAFGDAEHLYSFSAPIIFSPGSYWFSIAQGPSRYIDQTIIYGSNGDSYSGGYWSELPGQDAYFRIVTSQ